MAFHCNSQFTNVELPLLKAKDDKQFNNLFKITLRLNFPTSIHSPEIGQKKSPRAVKSAFFNSI